MKPTLLQAARFTPRMQDQLNAAFTVHHLPQADRRAGFLADVGDTIDAVLTDGGVGLETQVMDALPNLKVISNHGVGYDGIDANHAASRGILVTHTPGVLNDEVANTAIMLWLATSRKLVAYDRYVRDGRWESEGNPPLTQSPQNRKVGIVGLGRIGQAIADRLPPFNAEIAYHTRTKKDVPYRYYGNLTDMARDCDVLICITPGGESTRHIVNRDVLDALGPNGILVNVARGSVVDQDALISALQDGRLGAAGLDVFADEPHVPAELIAMDNATLQPHIGSATEETRRAMADLACDNLTRFFREGTVITPVPECAGLVK